MLTIHKYPIPAKGPFSLDLPKDAKILNAEVQGRQGPQMWVLADPEAPMKKRFFQVVGTDELIDIPVSRLEFVSTFQMNSGSLVFHLFEIKE